MTLELGDGLSDLPVSGEANTGEQSGGDKNRIYKPGEGY